MDHGIMDFTGRQLTGPCSLNFSTIDCNTLLDAIFSYKFNQRPVSKAACLQNLQEARSSNFVTRKVFFSFLVRSIWMLIYWATLLPAVMAYSAWRRLHSQLAAPMSDYIKARILTGQSLFRPFKITPLVGYLLAYGNDFQFLRRKATVESTVRTDLL